MGEQTFGGQARTRRETLGLSVRQAAEVTGVGRATIAKIERGDETVDELSRSRLSAAYDRLERRYGITEPDSIVQVIELPDGTRITHTGPPEGVAEAAQRFLSERKPSE